MSHATLLNAHAPNSDEISSRLPRNPGVMVLTHSPLLLSFISLQAKAIIDKWHRIESGGPRVGIPSAIITFCLDLLATLNDRREMESHLPFQLERNIETDGLYISLWGVGLPRSSEVDQSRMCILLEELAVERRPRSPA